MADDDSNYPIYPIHFVNGDHYPITGELPIQIVDPDPAFPDADPPVMKARNLTGWSAIAQVRRTARKDSLLVATFTVSGLDTDGMIYLSLPPAETRKVEREAFWDLQLTDPDGKPGTILGGPVIPQGDISR